MQLHLQAFSSQKAGNDVEECDDAASHEGKADFDGLIFRGAVADGATESSFSGIWARMLVRAFKSAKLTFPDEDGTLPLLQERWRRIVGKKKLPWYAEQKAQSGAFAALAGVVMRDDPDTGRMSWHAVAAGDSCLFHVRGDEVLASFPFSHPEQFSARPLLIASIPERNGDLEQSVKSADGAFCTDDTFFLMTDALACWFTKGMLEGTKPWSRLRDLATSEEETPFDEMITSLRASGELKNDDTTVLRIDVL